MAETVRLLKMPEPVTANPLTGAQAKVEAIKEERVALFLDRLAEVLTLATEIAAPDAGYRPGYQNGARRVLTCLTGERLHIQALHQRKP